MTADGRFQRNAASPPVGGQIVALELVVRRVVRSRPSNRPHYPHASRALVLALAIAVVAFCSRAAHAWIPNDRGINGAGWQADQWNFLPGTGVDAPRAWDNLFAAGRPGGKGVKIAVLDSGVAYANRGRFKKSPDLKSIRFAKGYDFCARTSNGLNACEGRDPYPNDDYGHGTHVTSTIAETPNNGLGLTGLAYGATIIPVKVLNARGEGDEETIAEGIRFAVKQRRADHQPVVRVRVEHDVGDPDPADRGRRPLRALARTSRSSPRPGNTRAQPRRLPGRAAGRDQRRRGHRARLRSPSTPTPARAWTSSRPAAARTPRCPTSRTAVPNGPHGRPIFQLTFTSKIKQTFGYPTDYFGTTMATPHVSATAALIIASGVLGPNPTPDQIEARLKATATDLGAPGPDETYGAGLVDAGAATAR